MKKLFLFTGGGLAPALNPTIYGVVKTAQEKGWQVIGGLYGWASLLRNGRHVDLTKVDVESIKNIGGTLLRSSRTNPLAAADGIDQVKEKISYLGIDAVVAIGGNDTLGAAAELSKAGIPIVGIPKTIDNDLAGTYFTPGFPSAAHYLSALTKEIRDDAAYALSRIFVIESYGMKAGWVASTACYGQADVIIPPERTISLRNTLQILNERYINNGNFAVVVVAQEAKFDEPVHGLKHAETGEQYGHARQNFVCLQLKEKIISELGIGTQAIYPGNFLETGKPIDIDRDMAISLGSQAVKLVDEGTFGHMVCVTRPDHQSIILSTGTTQLRSLVDSDNYRPFPDEYFDYKNLLPTKKFHEYMEPMLGVCQRTEDAYGRLMQAVINEAKK